MNGIYSTDHKLIAQRVKQARLFAKYTQAQLAEKVGVSTNALAKLEVGLMNPSLMTLVKISNVLECNINFFLTATQEKSPDVEIDSFLISIIPTLTQKEKEFALYFISGLRVYKE